MCVPVRDGGEEEEEEEEEETFRYSMLWCPDVSEGPEHILRTLYRDEYLITWLWGQFRQLSGRRIILRLDSTYLCKYWLVAASRCSME